MNDEIKLVERFGSFLADGDEANKFRFCEVETKFNFGQSVIFDFDGVDNMTDSFANACFGNIAEEHGEKIFELCRFKNCSPLIKDFLGVAIHKGLIKARK